MRHHRRGVTWTGCLILSLVFVQVASSAAEVSLAKARRCRLGIATPEEMSAFAASRTERSGGLHEVIHSLLPHSTQSIRPPFEVTIGNFPNWTQMKPDMPCDFNETGSYPHIRSGHNAVWDASRGRMMVFGGHLADQGNAIVRTDDLWAASFDEQRPNCTPPKPKPLVVWDVVSSHGNAPSPYLTSSSVVHDSWGDRLLVFGGFENQVYLGPVIRHNEVWAVSLTGGTWSTLAPLGPTPIARSGHTAIYDPIRNRMIVFGGFTPQIADHRHRNDVWALSLDGTPTWSLLHAGGFGPQIPAYRGLSVAIYDAVGDRMVMFGGVDYNGEQFNDTWALSLGPVPSWTQINANFPPAKRDGHAGFYDSQRRRLVIVGGYVGGITNELRDDVWALDLANPTAWTEPQCTGSFFPRVDHVAVYDPVHDRMVVHGGFGFLAPYGYVNLGDVHSLPLGGPFTWTQLNMEAAQMPPRASTAAAFGERAEFPPFVGLFPSLTVFGGGRFTTKLNDLWYTRLNSISLSGNYPLLAWTIPYSQNEPPSSRAGHTMVYDPSPGRIVIVGGISDALPYTRNDVWAVDMSPYYPIWAELTPAGPAPAARSGHSAIYDPVGDRMILFGGLDEPQTGRYNDVWALSLGGSPAWTSLNPAGPSPVGRYGHTAIYDPVRHEMVVHGGEGLSGSVFNDVWKLSLGASPAWTEVSPPPPLPAARSHHSAVYDTQSDRMILFGGQPTLSGRDDVWFLPLSPASSWFTPVMETQKPHRRTSHASIYFPALNRALVVGGSSLILGPHTAVFNDVWFLGNDVVPPGTTQTVTAQEACDAIRVSWLATGDDGNVGTAAAYELRRSENLITSSNYAGASVITTGTPGPPGTPHAATDVVGWCSPVYFYALKTRDESGNWSAMSNMASGYSQCPMPQDGCDQGLRARPIVTRLAFSMDGPNPVRASSQFRLDIPVEYANHAADIAVHDVAGRRIASLMHGSVSPGSHVVAWDLRDGGGNAVRDGVYYVRASVGSEVFRRTLVVMR